MSFLNLPDQICNMLKTGKNSVVVLYHKDLPEKSTGTIRNIRSPKASERAIKYLELWRAQVKLDCTFHLGWNQVFKKLFWRERRVSQPEGFMSPCVLWWWLPPCSLRTEWRVACVPPTLFLASWSLSAASGKDYERQRIHKKRERGIPNPIPWNNLFYKGNLFPWWQISVVECLWGNGFKTLLQIHCKYPKALCNTREAQGFPRAYWVYWQSCIFLWHMWICQSHSDGKTS